MKVIGTVEATGSIENKSKKDIEKGYRFLTVFRENNKKTINGNTFTESVVYQVKSVDDLGLEVGETYIFDGRVWEMKDDQQNTMRGMTGMSFEKR